MPAWPLAAPAAWNRPFLAIGHGGASAHAPANSLRSLALALEMGVDVVEFDVRPCRDALVLFHDDDVPVNGAIVPVGGCALGELRSAAHDGQEIPTLHQALDLLRGRALINLDLKAGGAEEAVLDALSARKMLGETLISCLEAPVLRRLRVLEPRVLTGYSYPQDRGGASGNPRLRHVVRFAVRAMRRALPYRVLRMMDEAQSNAVMLWFGVVSQAAVRTVHSRGGKVFAWTVDDEERLSRVRATGVNGIASNRPELFGR